MPGGRKGREKVGVEEENTKGKWEGVRKKWDNSALVDETDVH